MRKRVGNAARRWASACRAQEKGCLRQTALTKLLYVFAD